MKKLVSVLFVLAAGPVFAQQQQPVTPLQQYLYNESGYMPPAQQVYQAPPPVAEAPSATVAQAYNNTQTYDPQQAYAPVPEDDGTLYDDQDSGIGPGESSAGLRAMLTSSGF